MVAQRVQKILGAAGIASRRASEELIRAGRVTVGGRPATIGDVVDHPPAQDLPPGTVGNSKPVEPDSYTRIDT